jgi:DNA-binding CsgD family transcriptional regulator
VFGELSLSSTTVASPAKGVAMALVGQPVIVGRHAERAAMIDAVDRLAAGSGHLVHLSGEPGIGKTRMLSWLADAARARNLPVLSGSAAEFETDVPFGPLTQALTGRLTELRDDLRDRLSEERYRLVTTVFPTLATGSPTDLREAERYRLHRALRSLLEAITPATGLVLCLDDLHWADAATCDFLAHLLRQPPRAPLLLALSCRPRQQPARLADVLRGSPGTHLALQPLSRAETAALAGVDPASRRGVQLYSASGGNPLYTELLASSPASSLNAAGESCVEVLTDAFARELFCLNETDRLVLESAAVVGDEFDPNLVAAIAGRPVGDVLAALDRLAARDLVRAATTEPKLRHRHPLLRTAAYREADARWRLAAHRRAWDVLADQGAPATTMARHVAHSATIGDRAAIAVLLAAAEGTEVTAPASCAHWLAVALELVPDQPSDVDQRLRLLTMRAKALAMAGRFDPAHGALAEVLALLPADAHDRRAPVIAFLAMIERLRGRFDEAREMLVAELAASSRPGSVAVELTSGPAMVAPSGQPGPAAAVLLFELALGGLLGAAPEDPACWAEQAVTAARELGDPAQTAAALAVRSLHDLIRGRWTPETRDRVTEAVALTDSLTDGQLTERLDASVWVGWCELSMDRFVDAARHLERGLALSTATGQDHLVGYLRAGLGTAYASLGRLNTAAERVTDAVDNALGTGGDGLAGLALAQRGWIEAWRGNLAEATDIAHRIGEPKDGSMFAALSGAFLALVAHVAGDSIGCVDRLLRAGGGPDLPHLDGASRVCWFQLLAEAEVTAGRPDRAPAWATRAQRAADAMPHPRKLAFAELAKAWAWSTTEPAAAATVAERAARTFGELTDRVLQGRALLLAGQCRATAGDTEVAKRLLADAERVFTGCGAQGFADQAARARRRPGRRTGPDAAPSMLAGLTERERAVATLVAEGHSNREVASALYLSARTVEAHLTKVYAKLGLSSRSALASQVSRCPL